VLIYDDDHYCMGGLLAELLARAGCRVTIATPAPSVSHWTQFTLEQKRILKRLMHLGVRWMVNQVLDSIETSSAILKDGITGELREVAAEGVVLVTDRQPNDGLYHDLLPALRDGRLNSLRLIGDAEAPSLIAQAVFSGHQAAREFDEPRTDGTPFRVERMALSGEDC
jgi:dimethylamine/trimethylamine dehydrogenase